MVSETLKQECGLNLYNHYLEEIGAPERLGIREDPEMEGLYELYIAKDNQMVPLSNGIDESELSDEVIDTYYEISRKRYIVTCVGLPDGKTDAWLYCTSHAADNKVQQLIADEKRAHDDASVVKSDSICKISWAGGSEKMIIRVHEDRAKFI